MLNEIAELGRREFIHNGRVITYGQDLSSWARSQKLRQYMAEIRNGERQGIPTTQSTEAEIDSSSNADVILVGRSTPHIGCSNKTDDVGDEDTLIDTIDSDEYRPKIQRRRNIYPQRFETRLTALFRSWKKCKQELWGSVDAIAVASPPSTPPQYFRNDELPYVTSRAFHIWLFGITFPNTLMLFLPGSLHILCDLEQIRFFPEQFCVIVESVTGIEVVVHNQLETIFDALKWRLIYDTDSKPNLTRRIKCSVLRKKSPRLIGDLEKEVPKGELMNRWYGLLQEFGFIPVDVSDGFSELLAVKDEDGLYFLSKASLLSSSVLNNFVVPRLQEVMKKAETISHSDLQGETEDAIWFPSSKAKVKDLALSAVDVCCTPFFQSAGKFDPYGTAVSNDDPLYYGSKGVIICGLGARYNDYCSNIVRTFLIDPNEYQEKAYKLLLKAHEEAMKSLVPCRPMNAVYQAALDVILQEGPDFQPYFRTNVGTGIGIEFCESWLALSPSNEREVEDGMAFNVVTGFHGLQIPTSENPKIRNFSLLLADTVVVKEYNGPEITTRQCSRSFANIVLPFKDKVNLNECVLDSPVEGEEN